MGNNLSKYAHSINQYYFSLLSKGYFPDQQNYVFSPFSIVSVLHLVSMIVPEDVREEIFNYIELPPNSDPLPQFDDGIISSANSVWYNKNVISPETLEFIKKYGSIQPLSITGSKDTINQYCKEKTHGHICKILNEDLDPLTNYFLVNVFHFEGKWKKQFKPSIKQVFYGKTKKLVVDMMELNCRLKISEDKKMVLIPFQKDYEMFVHIGDFPTYSAETFSSLISNMKFEKVVLYLPKFSIDSFFDFDQELKELKLYNDSNITHTYQFAKIDVDEKGAVASAASAEYKFGLSIFSPTIYYIRVDKPFHYFIIQQSSNAILFAGQINDLGEESDDPPVECIIF